MAPQRVGKAISYTMFLFLLGSSVCNLQCCVMLCNAFNKYPDWFFLITPLSNVGETIQSFVVQMIALHITMIHNVREKITK